MIAIRQRAGFGELDGVGNVGTLGRPLLSGIVGRHDVERRQACLEAEDRIALLPDLHLGIGPVLEAQVLHAVMVVVAVRLGLEQGGPLALTSTGDCLSGSFVHGDGIHAVDDHAGHPVALGAIDDVGDRHRLVTWGELAVFIVLTGEHDRESQRTRHVGGLVERPDVGGPVAEERNGDIAVISVLVTEGRADGNG